MKITSTEVKNSFGKYLRICSVEPVYITKNGEVIAKLVNYIETYENNYVNEAIVSYDLDRVYMSFEAFEEMNASSNIRYEYINGEVYMLSSPGVKHQRIVSRFHIALNTYLSKLSCDVFVAPFDITIKNKKKHWNIVQPDLMVLCDWQDDTDEKDRYRGIPNLVVEVLSHSNSKKEMITKLNLYKASGIEEYWIIDPYLSEVLVYQFKDNSIINIEVYSDNEIAKSFVYANFEFCVKEY